TWFRRGGSWHNLLTPVGSGRGHIAGQPATSRPRNLVANVTSDQLIKKSLATGHRHGYLVKFRRELMWDNCSNCPVKAAKSGEPAPAIIANRRHQFKKRFLAFISV